MKKQLEKPQMWYVPQSNPRKGKTFEMPSLTEPNQSVSPQTVLAREKNGILTTGAKMEDAQWNDEVENPLGIDPRRLDFTEIQELATRQEKKIVEFLEGQKKAKTDAQNAAQEARIQAEVEKRLKELQTQP